MNGKLLPVGTLLVPNEYQQRNPPAHYGIIVSHVKVPWGMELRIFLNNGNTVRQNSTWIYDLFDPVKT